MRFRVSGFALLLSIALPPLLGAAGSTSPLAERAAHAADPVTEVARQRYEEGVKAFDAGRFEDARTAFLQAYALKRHPAVLLNLGLSELRSGHPEDAGNHLQQFLREHAAATPEQRASAEKALGDAKKKAGFIVVIVDVNNADVSVDGTFVGRSPLLDPVFVKPGKHTVVATLNGKTASTQIDAKMGTAAPANLVLGGGAAPPIVAPVPTPAPSPAPAPPPSPPPSSSPMPEAPPPAQPIPPVGYAPAEPQPLASASATSADVSVPPDSAPSGREPLFDWYKRKPLAWVGTGLTGVGLIMGVAFSAAASSASSAAEQHSREIENYAARDPSAESRYNEDTKTYEVCGSPDSSSGDLPGYEKACDALRQDISDYDTDVAFATVGWVTFGVGLLGTVTYAMIDWFPKKQRKTGAFEPRVVGVAPVVTPTARGMGLVGTF